MINVLCLFELRLNTCDIFNLIETMSYSRCPVWNRFRKTNIKRYENIQDEQIIIFGQSILLNIHIEEKEVRSDKNIIIILWYISHNFPLAKPNNFF